SGGAAAPAQAAPAAAAPAPEPVMAEEEPAKPAVVGSVYERMGGLSVIDAVIEVAFRNIMEDGALKGLFKGVNMDVLQGKQRAFFSKILGGPDEYRADLGGGPGRPLAEGMGPEHYD